MRALLLAVCLLTSHAAIVVPALTGRVVDEVGLLSNSDKSQITGLIQQLESKGEIQMAVLIPRTLQDTDIESYSIAVLKEWKLGYKGTDRGLLLTIVPSERQMRLEVGYGLEGTIPDAIAKRIISDVMTPYFREGSFGNGIQAAIAAIATRIQADIDVGDLPQPKGGRLQQQPALRSFIKLLPLLLIFFILFMQSLFRHHRYGSGYNSRSGWGRNDWWGGGGGWGGGGFGGGGGGFGGGGGGFGGGGASGRW